ncbi:MAG TPA: hypothetical protein VK208_09140 [Pyrinomonadaceae bacterium]|nr:hypothetical protein [Pyrinomonadaceae bacterium]
MLDGELVIPVKGLSFDDLTALRQFPGSMASIAITGRESLLYSTLARKGFVMTVKPGKS